MLRYLRQACEEFCATGATILISIVGSGAPVRNLKLVQQEQYISLQVVKNRFSVRVSIHHSDLGLSPQP
jgi:hypothetical protein